MVLPLVNVFLKHSTSFPSPHFRMIFVDKLYHSLFSMKIYWPTFFRFPVVIIIIIIMWDKSMVDISSTPFLGDFVDRNSFPISTILFVNWTMLVKSTLNRPSFGGGSFVHSCPPIPPIYGDTLLVNSMETFFSGQIRFQLFCTCIIFGVNPLLNFAPSPFLLWNGSHRAS